MVYNIDMKIETIEINGNVWKKFKGDEGQDVYVAEFIKEDESVLGNFPDESFYDILIDSDADFYLPSNDIWDKDSLTEDRVAFKFRKNVFTEEEQKGAYEGLYDAAVVSDNRGYAAGNGHENSLRDYVSPYEAEVIKYFEDGQPKSLDGSDVLESIRKKHESGDIDSSKARYMTWIGYRVARDFGDPDNNDRLMRNRYVGFFDNKLVPLLKSMDAQEAKKYIEEFKKKYISITVYANPLWSGIAGYYGRYPRIPYGRAVAYTERNMEKFAKSFPFARKLNSEFKRLMPVRWGVQNGYTSKLDEKFLIGEDTVFTTITVNTTSADRNARMACHRDAGSLNDGFSNLTVVTKEGKNWKGGYLVTPEVRAAINVRPGDLLLIDNMRIIHANTPIEAPDSGEEDFLRMSLVFYFREDMKVLGSWEYEKVRRQFVDDRRMNQNHPLWRKTWNGVSPNMWYEQEWYDYLTEKMGRDILEKYHPEALKEKSPTLEGFFGL